MRPLTNLARAAIVVALSFVGACGTSSDVDADSTSSSAGDTTTTITSTVSTTSMGTGGAAPALCGFSARYGDASAQDLISMSVDATGAIVLAGVYRGALDFGDQVLDSGSVEDGAFLGGAVFLARLDASGQTLWSRTFGAAEDNRIASTAVDVEGNVLLATTAEQPIDFGAGAIDPVTSSDAFLAKLSLAGETQWSRRVIDLPGAIDGIFVEAVRTDRWGNIVVHGNAWGDHRYLFVAKIDALGHDVWKQVIVSDDGVLSYDGDQSFTVDDQGSATLFLGVWGAGTVDFGDGPLSVAEGANNGLVARFDASGKLVYARLLDALGGAGNDVAEAGPVIAGKHGEVYLSATFRGTIDVGQGPLTPAGDNGMFVAKLDAAGNTLWARAFGDGVHVNALALAPDGRLVLGGYLDGSVDFGSGLLVNTDDQADVIVAALDASTGAPLTGRSYGDGSGEIKSLGVGPSGSIIASGAVIGDLQLCDKTLVSAGERDVFVADLTP